MTENKIQELFPYLRVHDANTAISFYKKAFGATETFRLVEPSGRVGHAELNFGGHTVMLSDAYPEYNIHAPDSGRPTGSAVHLHVSDVDAMTRDAAEAGAQVLMEPADQSYGERASKILDPFGHEWILGSNIEDMTHAEMQRRFTAMFQ